MEAKQTAAIEQALKIFEYAASLLPYANFAEKDNLEMKINLALGECQFICKKYAEARERFERLIDRYNTEEYLITIKTSYLNLHACNGDNERTIELGSEVLNHLNFKFNIKHLALDLIKGKLLFSNKSIEKIKKAPLITNRRLLDILKTLTTMLPAANSLDEKIFQLILLKIGNLSVKHGNSPYAPVGYGASSYLLYNVWKDHKKAKKLEDVTLELLEDTDSSSTKTIVYSFMGTFIHHWTSPMGNSMEYLTKSIDEGAKIGEFLYSGYAIASTIYAKYVVGTPLKEITAYIDSQVKKHRGWEVTLSDL